MEVRCKEIRSIQRGANETTVYADRVRGRVRLVSLLQSDEVRCSLSNRVQAANVYKRNATRGRCGGSAHNTCGVDVRDGPAVGEVDRAGGAGACLVAEESACREKVAAGILRVVEYFALKEETETRTKRSLVITGAEVQTNLRSEVAVRLADRAREAWIVESEQ